MRVAHVIAGCNHTSSGTSYFITNACAALARSGVTVDLHALGAPQIEGVNVYNYPRGSGLLWNVGWSPAMHRGLRRVAQEVDVMHTNGVWLMPNVYPAWVKPHKFVVSPHGMLSAWALQRSRLKKRIFGWLCQDTALRSADMFFATSQKEYEEIRDFGFHQPVAVIPIGIDIPEVVVRAKPDGEALRRLVFLGRLHPVKAVDRLIFAWDRCRPEGWELVIAGPDAGAASELQKTVRARAIPRVRFVGEVTGSSKKNLLENADVLALVSHTENFGASVVEALSLGTPVLASQGTPWQGVVENGCGWWIDNSVESIRRTIDCLAKMPCEELRQMGDRGREWMKRDFSWTRVGEKMKLTYEWLCKGGACPEWVYI